MSPDEREEIRSHARRAAADAPPLTDHQLDRLRALLPPASAADAPQAGDNTTYAQAAGGAG